MSDTSRRFIAATPTVMLGLLFGSGFSALVYQILWLRLLGLVFGVTVHAASTVLAAFMAGLALGSFVSGRLADRVVSPLRWFGLVELAIGAAALSTQWLLPALEEAYRLAYVHDLNAAQLTALRFTGSLLGLIIPTTLMGATMPLAMRAAITRASRFGGRAAIFYAANTAGAVMGAWLTGYHLVSSIGIARSFQLAAAVNLVVGVAALLWRTHRDDSPAVEPPTSDSRGVVQTPVSPQERRAVLVVAAASGFVGLALEVIWFRSLLMFLTANIYVFTNILAIVLGGIACGSALMARGLRRNRDWIARLAVLQTAVAVTAVASLAAQAWTYSRGWRTSAVVQGSAVSVLPTMLLMGAAFPVALHCWAGRQSEQLGDRVGRFYVMNLAGAIAGAVAAGFLAMPYLGIRGSLIAAAGVSLASGIMLLLLVARRRPRFAVGFTAAATLAFVSISAVLPDPLSAALGRRYGGERLLWREDGVQATVSVQQQPGGQRVLYLDGLHQTNDSPGMVAVHAQIGSLAMAVHDNPRDALVIGLGGGATAGAVARFSTAAVDIVELSPSVVHGAEWFRHVNGDVLRQPNARLRIDDGRNYLLLTPRRYDVITADIIQPFHAGAGNLYSLEYYQLASRVLRDGGVMLQWIGQRPEVQYKLIARTFLEAFPHTTMWAGGSLMVGTARPLRLSRSSFERRLADPAVGGALAAAGIGSFEALLALYTAGADQLRRFVGDGPVLTDDRPLVEYFRSLPGNGAEVVLDSLRGDVSRHVTP